MTDRLIGKTALITGAASGIGKACAEKFALEGAHVVVTDIDYKSAQKIAENLPSKSLGMELDVRKPDHWHYVADEIKTRFGRVDILVNNAGIARTDNPETAPIENLRETNAINVEGVFLGCQTVIPNMAKTGGGSIVNISSIVGMQGFSSLYTYAASKGAIRAMTKSIAMYCQEKAYKIRCNSIHPSGIETPLVQTLAGRKGQEEDIPHGVLPYGVRGHPDDIANTALFLASDESRYITGGEFIIDNGALIRPSHV